MPNSRPRLGIMPIVLLVFCLTMSLIGRTLPITINGSDLTFHGIQRKDTDQLLVPEATAEGNESITVHFRKQRATLSWPGNRMARMVTDYYINMDIPSAAGTFMPVSMEAKIEYLLPDVEYSFGRSLEDRRSIFGLIESFLDHFGLEGKTCIQRALCERAENHIMVDGIMGEIVTLLLEYGSISEGEVYKDYHEAREYGLAMSGCENKYHECPFSIFTWLER